MNNVIDRIAACLFTGAVFFAGCAAEAAPVESEVQAPIVSEEVLPIRMSYEPAKTFYSVPLTTDIQLHIKALSHEAGIDPAVILAMIEVESNYDSDALGDGDKSYGLMQIQPRWHSERMAALGVTDLLDPKQNVTVGVDILAELVAKYDGNVEMALVAYNAGPTGAYRNWFSRGVYASDYSRKVLKISGELKGGS